MKKAILLLLTTAFLAYSFSQYTIEKEEISDSDKTADSLINAWFEFHQVAEQDFESCGALQAFNVEKFQYGLSKDQRSLFSTLFVYASDSSFYIDLDSYSLSLEKDKKGDLFSYGFEIDSKVQLINCVDSTVLELLYCGTDCIPEEAFWKNNNEVWITGLSYKSDYFPTIWKYDLKSHTYEKCISTKSTNRKPSGYTAEIRLRHIEFRTE